MKALLDGQKKSWKLLAEGYASLSSVRQREVACNGFNVTLQFNPGRMTSTAAPVDAESIKRRSCFLCVENLPREQDGFLYANDFVILCNPAPIFPQHFTVSHLRHRPQALEPFLSQFLLMARNFSPEFSVFYNGPQCGASAPDHMHFQASPIGLIPVEHEAQQSVRRTTVASFEKTEILTLKDFGRETIIVEGSDSERIGKILKKLLASLKKAVGTTEEPMVNILCSFSEALWRVILFPRAKHRPDAFFRNDDSRILVSPAAVDMGGLIITPSERDFNRLDGRIIESIYSEVSLDRQTVHRALEALS
ncbi:MAG TPA: DUF4922 domain-containing protein [Bacteroidota bacterium]|nr:DUF4922 domain-containing protein [Bacteroidota bacterium]